VVIAGFSFVAGIVTGAYLLQKVKEWNAFGPPVPSETVRVDIHNDTEREAHAVVINTYTRSAAFLSLDPNSQRRFTAAGDQLPELLARHAVIVITYDEEGLLPLPVRRVQPTFADPAFLEVVPRLESPGGVLK
jgi:hypothetical protein